MKIVQEPYEVRIVLEAKEPVPKVKIQWETICFLCNRKMITNRKPRHDRRNFCQHRHATYQCVKDYQARKRELKK